MGNKDGWRKNLEVLQEEWSDFWFDTKRNLSRLARPSLNPKNREHFVPHVLTAFVSTFYGLRRTLTYATILYLLGRFVVVPVVNLLGGIS